MKETTALRLRKYMQMMNLRQTDIIEKCEPYCKMYNVKLSKSILSQYIKGSFEPKQDKLTVLAKGLDVSEAWLMGFDVPMEVEPEISDSKQQLIDEFSRKIALLNENEIKDVKNFVEFILNKRS